MKSLEDTVARARLLMAIDLTDKTVERTATVADEFEVLREQITTLTEQVISAISEGTATHTLFRLPPNRSRSERLSNSLSGVGRRAEGVEAML